MYSHRPRNEHNIAISVIRLIAIAAVTIVLAGQRYALAEIDVATDAPHAQDTVLIGISAGTDVEEALSTLRKEGLSSVDVESSELLADGVLSIPLAKGASVEDALAELGPSDAVESAQPDYLYQVMGDGGKSLVDILFAANNANLLANDPLFQNQWGLQSINAPAAWSLMLERGVSAKVGVAVMDSGFAVDHEDLADSIPDGAPYNAYYASRGREGDELRDVAPGPASTAHGTHVAGIVAATGDNGRGVCGVSRSAQIVPIRVYNYETGSDAGATTSALVKAYDYVIENKDKLGIRVVCMSLGVAYSAPFSPDDLLLSKIDEAFAEGIVTVAAAGNNAYEKPYDCYPGDYETVVSAINLQTASSIGQTGSLAFEDAKDVSRAASSNRNAPGETDKNISAPGTRVLSTSTSESYGFGSYQYLSGTSMACPHVAGVLALMFAVSPGLAAQEAVDVLYSSARDIGAEGWDEEYGYGEVDAYGAIKALLDGRDESEEVCDGWKDLGNGEKGYVREGSLVTGWMDLGDAKYWFGSDGVMATGWREMEVNGATVRYYFRPSGNLARGAWATIDGKNYYFRPSGSLATGWATIEDKGVEKKYYFDDAGQLVTGWQDIDNGQGKVNHYYFRPSGSMATGWATIDGQKYWFRPSGNMATGFADVDDAFKRYFDEEGHMVTGWQQINGNTYFFRASGAMQTGTAYIDGKTYEFASSGTLKS